MYIYIYIINVYYIHVRYPVKNLNNKKYKRVKYLLLLLDVIKIESVFSH